MNKVKKALGIKVEPTHESITLCMETKKELEKWKSKANQIQNILSNLDTAFKNHKHDFPLIRYSNLKEMIKDTLLEHTNLTTKDESQSQTTGVTLGKISRLREHVAEFLPLQADAAEYTQLKEMIAQEVEDYTLKMKEEIKKCEEIFGQLEDSLKTLERGYRESKQYWPPRRYYKLKAMIRDAISATATGKTA